jgi:hypothetical protein
LGERDYILSESEVNAFNSITRSAISKARKGESVPWKEALASVTLLNGIPSDARDHRQQEISLQTEGDYLTLLLSDKHLQKRRDSSLNNLTLSQTLSAMPQDTAAFPVECTCVECGSSLTVTEDDADGVPGDLSPWHSARVVLEDYGWSRASEPPLCS